MSASDAERPMFADTGQARSAAGAKLLLGTQRLAEPVGVEPTWKDVVSPEGTEAEEAFGRVLAGLYLLGQAGRAAVMDDGVGRVGEPAEDGRPMCSANMNAILIRVFGQEPMLVPAWCQAARKLGVAPWAEHVPALLSYAANLPGGSPTARGIVQTVGPRAQWLSALNPAWRRLSGAGAQSNAWDQWDDLTGDARVRMFEAIRAAEPARALEVLTGAWADEPSETRGKLLAALGVNLSESDEAFLEGLLDDKRKTVREKAAEILAGIAKSRMVERMAARVRGCMRVEGGRLIVEPIAALDKEMIRDGMTEKSQVQLLGQKAWLLYQVVAGIPLRRWQETVGLGPEASWKAVQGSEWAEAFAHAWGASWLRWPDAAWTESLLERAWQKKNTEGVEALLARMDAGQHEAALLPRLDGAVYESLMSHSVLSAIKPTEHVWSARLTKAFMEALGRMKARFDANDKWVLRQYAMNVADCLDAPTMAGYLAAGTQQTHNETWIEMFNKVSNKIEIRAAIQKEMAT